VNAVFQRSDLEFDTIFMSAEGMYNELGELLMDLLLKPACFNQMPTNDEEQGTSVGQGLSHYTQKTQLRN
jgi:hypothetical protein